MEYTSDIFESMKVENIIHKHNLCDSNVGFMETSKMHFTIIKKLPLNIIKIH